MKNTNALGIVCPCLGIAAAGFSMTTCIKEILSPETPTATRVIDYGMVFASAVSTFIHYDILKYNIENGMEKRKK